MCEPALAGTRIETELKGKICRREQRQLLWGLCGGGAGGHVFIIAKGCDGVLCGEKDHVSGVSDRFSSDAPTSHAGRLVAFADLRAARLAE